jgi:hypothetical protein
VSISQEWLVTEDSATPVWLEITDAFSATGLPGIGDAYTKPGTAITLGYYVTSRTARRRLKSQVMISVTYGYSPRVMPQEPSDTNPQNIDPAQPGYCDVQVSARDITKDWYRAGASAPSLPLSVMEAITDGTATDTGGKPTHKLSRTTEVVVSIVDVPANVPKLSTIYPMMNTRNTNELFGTINEKSAIMLPPRMQRRSGTGLMELQLRWTVDDDYHMQQLADMDPNTGRPKVAAYPTATDPLHASPVYWVTDVIANTAHDTLLTSQQTTLLTDVLS